MAINPPLYNWQTYSARSEYYVCLCETGNCSGRYAILEIRRGYGGHSIAGNAYGFYIIVSSLDYYKKSIENSFKMIGKINNDKIIEMIKDKRECPHNIKNLSILFTTQL